MKNLKITLIAVLVAFLSNGLVAQEKTDKPTKQERRAEMVEQFKIIKEKLALTPDQEVKFKEISKKYREKAKTIKDVEGDRKEKRKQIMEVKSQKDAEMKAFLSESQFKTYLEIKDDMKEKHKEKMKNRQEN